MIFPAGEAAFPSVTEIRPELKGISGLIFTWACCLEYLSFFFFKIVIDIIKLRFFFSTFLYPSCEKNLSGFTKKSHAIIMGSIQLFTQITEKLNFFGAVPLCLMRRRVKM
jgi:hypothetical protein